ncbi:MAG: type II secretion system protein GspG, partial [Deltaproteobacteria bacterium]|nr:type II secretion system protein GspG [Deltaproteobacteria bacterium]
MTLLEVVLGLAIFSILVGMLAPALFSVRQSAREREAVNRLEQFKRGIVGDPRIVTREARTAFGFFGDMGNFPANLDDLWMKNGFPAFSFNSTLKAGSGWAGPYVDPGISEFLDTLKKDPWGSDYQYTVADGSSAATGEPIKAKIVSLGPDRQAGTSDDLTVEVFTRDLLSKAVGYVRDANGNLMAGATVTINYPLNGAMTTQTVQTSTNGFYEFNIIPFGNRSIKIEPRLIYVADSAVTVGGAGNTVKFLISNFASANISITSFKAEFDSPVSPLPSCFKTLKIAGQTNYDSENPRLCSGDTVSFSGSPVTVTGTGSVSGQTSPLRIQTPVTEVADLNVGLAAKKGGTIKIEMQQFKDAVSGAATAVDMTGV